MFTVFPIARFFWVLLHPWLLTPVIFSPFPFSLPLPPLIQLILSLSSLSSLLFCRALPLLLASCLLHSTTLIRTRGGLVDREKEEEAAAGRPAGREGGGSWNDVTWESREAGGKERRDGREATSNQPAGSPRDSPPSASLFTNRQNLLLFIKGGRPPSFLLYFNPPFLAGPRGKSMWTLSSPGSHGPEHWHHSSLRSLPPFSRLSLSLSFPVVRMNQYAAKWHTHTPPNGEKESRKAKGSFRSAPGALHSLLLSLPFRFFVEILESGVCELWLRQSLLIQADLITFDFLLYQPWNTKD